MNSDISAIYDSNGKCQTYEECQKWQDEICSSISSGTGGWQLTSTFEDQNWFLYLGLVSAVVATSIALIIW